MTGIPPSHGENTSTNHWGPAHGVIRVVLRVEGAAVCLLAALLYWKVGASWWLFALLFLTPDLSFLAYLAGARAGSIAYNTAHAYVGPVALAMAGLLAPWPMLLPLSLVWAAHIGFDRLLGYGLKYAAGFGFTHLGRIGRDRGGRAERAY